MKRQIINRGIRFARAAIGPYTTRIGNRTFARAAVLKSDGYGPPIPYTDSDWTLETGVTVSNGVLTTVPTPSGYSGYILDKGMLTPGKTYKMSWSQDGTNIGVQPRIGSTPSSPIFTAGDFSIEKETDTDQIHFLFQSSMAGTVSNIVVREKL